MRFGLRRCSVTGDEPGKDGLLSEETFELDSAAWASYFEQ